MNLYRWQKQALRVWENHGFRGIIQAATGTGKTILALAAIDRLMILFPDLVVKVVVPAVPLARQWSEALLRHAEQEVFYPGFIGDGTRDPAERRVLVYIVNSARSCLADHMRREIALGHHVLLICDECHHVQSPANRKIFDFLSLQVREGLEYMSLGLSATPLGTAHDEILIDSLGSVIFRYDIPQAAADGVLSPFLLSEVGTSFSAEELDRYSQLSREIFICLQKLYGQDPSLRECKKPEFMRRIQKMAAADGPDTGSPAGCFLLATYERKRLTNLAHMRLECCLTLLEHLPKNRRVLIFCERISQAEELIPRLREMAGPAVSIYHSQMSKTARERILKAFRDHALRILVSCKCLDEGVDVPDADAAIVLSSSAVSRQRIQRLGRILRRSPGKPTACLYYIYIRESTDDVTYLKGLEAADSFSLRYWPPEQSFSNDIYEFAAIQVLKKAKEKGLSEPVLGELRKCLNEGLVRGDCLLPENLRIKQAEQAHTIHEKNYWKAMAALAKVLR